MQLSQSPRIHPLIAAAAVSIIVVCMLGTAVLANMLPLAPPTIRTASSGGTAAAAKSLSVNTVDAAKPPTAPTMPTTAIPAPANASAILVTPAQQNVRPAFDTPAKRVDEPAASPVVSAPSSAADMTVPTQEHADGKGLRLRPLHAARRTTTTSAQPRAPRVTSEEDSPVQLRPEQREAARLATTALARMSQEVTQESGGAMPNDATSRPRAE